MNIRAICVWIGCHRFVLLCGAVIAVSIFLRFYDLGTESIYLDEAESIKESSLTIQAIANSANQPPLYFLLLRAWIHLFGTGETAIRSLSAIFGVGAVAIIYSAGRTLLNNRAALIAALLTAFAYFPIKYSQDARAYSLLLFLSLLAYWCFLQILKKNTLFWYFAYLVACLLVSYTHMYGLLIVASQVIFFLIFHKKYSVQRWRLFCTLAIYGLFLIPLALLFENKIVYLARNGFWIREPGIGDVVNNLAFFSGAGSPQFLLLVIFSCLAVFGCFKVYRLEKDARGRQLIKHQAASPWKIGLESPEIITLLVLWLWVPILIPFIESKFMTPVYQAKYAIGAFPAFCLLAARGIDNIKWQWLFYPLLITVIILSSLGLEQYYKNDTNEQWREVVGLIDSNSKPGDIIVVCEGYYLEPFDYYYKGNLTQIGINDLDDAKQFADNAGNDISVHSGRLWLVLAYGKRPISDYFIDLYGKNSVDLAAVYVGITVALFDLPLPEQAIG